MPTRTLKILQVQFTTNLMPEYKGKGQDYKLDSDFWHLSLNRHFMAAFLRNGKHSRSISCFQTGFRYSIRETDPNTIGGQVKHLINTNLKSNKAM